MSRKSGKLNSANGNGIKEGKHMSSIMKKAVTKDET